MDNMKEKLNTFTSLVLDDAGTQREKLMEKIQHKRDTMLNAKETEFLEEAYEIIQRSISDAKKTANEKVLHVELEARKQLLLTREKIINDVMEAASDKLKGFTKTDDYGKWLLGKIEKAIFEVGKGPKIVYISSDDIRFRDQIEALGDRDHSKLSVEAADEKDFIGGTKVFNPARRVSVDYSFKEMLAEEKKTFLQRSGLTIG